MARFVGDQQSPGSMDCFEDESCCDSKRSIDVNRDSGIVIDEDQQFNSLDALCDFNAGFTTSQQQPATTSCSTLGKIDYGQDDDGDTILHLAVVGHTPDVVQDLMKNCDLNITNNMKQTPLHVASMANRPEMVKLLLLGGSKVDAHDWKGNTPLHLACQNGYTDVAIVIIESIRSQVARDSILLKQYLELKNFDGQSCLHLAAAHNRSDIIDILVNRYDADLNVQNSKSGATIMHEAVAKLNDGLVRNIVSLKKHCNRIDFYGRKPLDTIAMLQQSRLDKTQMDKLGLISDLIRDRIKVCIAQGSGCCTTKSLNSNEAILDSSSSSDYTDSDSDMSS